jgi:hypothetical protein
MRWSRVRAGCGLIGPAAFTAAWALGTHRQVDYSIRDEHISGLAAPDAEIPHVMTMGFLTLGTCGLLFAEELHRRLDHGRRAGAGPWLLGLSSLSMIAAGVLRRDRMSNAPPQGEPEGQSLINDLHDAAAVVGSGAGVLGMLALARRFRGDGEWASLAAPAAAGALVSGGLMAYFAIDVTRPGNGLVQRAAVSIPLAFMAATAVRMLRRG